MSDVFSAGLKLGASGASVPADVGADGADLLPAWRLRAGGPLPGPLAPRLRLGGDHRLRLARPAGTALARRDLLRGDRRAPARLHAGGGRARPAGRGPALPALLRGPPRGAGPGLRAR